MVSRAITINRYAIDIAVNHRSSFWALCSLVVQGCVGVAALVVVAVVPSTRGRLLIVPLTPQATASLPSTATNLGVRLIGKGPLPGSLIVDANGVPMVAAMLRHGRLALAAPAALCGENVDRRSGT